VIRAATIEPAASRMRRYRVGAVPAALNPLVCPAPDGSSTHTRVDTDGARFSYSIVAASQRSCLCHSPTLRPWITGREHGVLRGGELEPGVHQCH
jgi:hypothetical protein